MSAHTRVNVLSKDKAPREAKCQSKDRTKRVPMHAEARFARKSQNIVI